MKIKIYKNLPIKWAYCGCSETPSPVLPISTNIWDYANHLIELENGTSLKWSNDYPKALEAHKAMGGGEIINTPDHPLKCRCVVGHGYCLVEEGVEVVVEIAPPLGMYDHDSYFN